MRIRAALYGCVCFCAGLFVMYLCAAGPVVVDADCQEEPCAVPPCCNGDTNGDGSIDIKNYFIWQHLDQSIVFIV